MGLDRATMITAALKLLDETGLEGLTLRRLAADLGVQAPAIYWHFKSKQELLDHMATAVMLEGLREMRIHPRMRWERWAMEYGRGVRRILLRYRDGAKMISGTRLTDRALYGPMEDSLRILERAGFSLRESVVAGSTIYSYVVGFAIEEQAVYPRPGKRDEFYDLEARAKRIDEKELPLAQKAGAELLSDFDRRFAAGLRVIVRGIAVSIKRKSR
jgi:TetR/AcrR family transcriptional regulator, tetracycline repressor protein